MIGWGQRWTPINTRRHAPSLTNSAAILGGSAPGGADERRKGIRTARFRTSSTLGRIGGFFANPGSLKDGGRGQRRIAAAPAFRAGTPERRPATVQAVPDPPAATGRAWRTCASHASGSCFPAARGRGDLADVHALSQQHRHPALHAREAEGFRSHRRIDAGMARRVGDQHQRRDRPEVKVRLLPAHRVDVQHQRRQGGRASHHRRAAGALTHEPRQRPRQQTLEDGIVLRRAGEKETALVEQTIAGPQQIPGAVVRRNDPPAPIELDDAQPGGVEQLREGRAQSAGASQRLLDAPRSDGYGAADAGSIRAGLTTSRPRRPGR